MRPWSLVLLLPVLAVFPLSATEKPKAPPPKHYLGFDRNDYPGDERMRDLRRIFSFSSYWLNSPPGTSSTTWTGKRKFMQSLGYGFLVLFQGKMFSELKDSPDPATMGTEDAFAAIQAAQAEGFPRGTVIFLDHEEGGKLLPPQRLYLHAWVDQVNRSPYRAGVYSSGTAVRKPSGEFVSTATDIKEHAGHRRLKFWVSNVACPPSPGCLTALRPPPQDSGISFASVWQFAQSPKRMPISASCPGAYRRSHDKHPGHSIRMGDVGPKLRENCYPPELDVFVDINSSTSPDPSHGRTRPRSTGKGIGAPAS